MDTSVQENQEKISRPLSSELLPNSIKLFKIFCKKNFSTRLLRFSVLSVGLGSSHNFILRLVPVSVRVVGFHFGRRYSWWIPLLSL
jgi:hypothetical protein